MDTFGSVPGAEKTIPAGTLIAGRYRIVKPLGTGGMGSVYLATDRVLGDERIAIKILHGGLMNDPTQTARFLREVQLMRKVNHKNVVRTYDVGTDGQHNYFTMEFVPGIQLEKMIIPGGIPKDKIPSFALQICEALQAIHSANIIHRDLKPGNILVLDDCTIRITDFGVARPEVSNLTAHDEIVGSVCYIAPEIWLGKKVGPSVDLYALGVILYELATGLVPFDGESPAVLMRAHLDKAPKPPKSVNPNVEGWLNKLILRLLAKSVNDRPRDAKEVIEFLKLHSGGHSPDQSGTHDTVEPFFAELESKSRILTTVQPEVEPEPAAVNAQHARATVLKRKLKQGGASAKKKTVHAGAWREAKDRTIQTAALVSAMSIFTWALSQAIAAILPQFPALASNNELLERIEDFRTLGLGTMLTLGVPHLLLYCFQLSIPALLIGGAVGSNTQALRSYFASVCFLVVCFGLFAGYFLIGAPTKEHITGISVLSAMMTAKDQLGSVALLSPVTTVYEQIVLGDGLIQSASAVAPLIGSSMVLCAFFVYACGIAYFTRRNAQELNGSVGRAHLAIGIGLVIVVMTEGFVLKSLSPHPWTSYWQFSLRLPPVALVLGVAHWAVIFVTVLFATMRGASRRRPKR